MTRAKIANLSLLALLVGASLSGCRTAPAPAPHRSRSAADLYAEAAQHDSEAESQDALGRELATSPGPRGCPNAVVTDQSTSGTERLTPRPCWSIEPTPSERHHQTAQRLRDEAAAHRAEAHALLAAEREACAGLDPSDVDESPFWHRDDILAVEAELAGARIRGARVLFRAVPGLTVAWLERVLACHQARAAALGYPPTHLGYCPAVVEGTRVEVSAASGGIVVTMRADDDAAALTIYGRAEALLEKWVEPTPEGDER